MRQPQCGEVFLAHGVLRDQDDEQGDEEAERGGDLDEAGVEAALAVGDVLGDVDRGAAVFAAQGQALQDANQQQSDGREPSGGLIGGQQADDGGGAAHNRQRDEEGVLAPDEVADPSEEECAEGAHDKADREGGEIGDVGEGVVARRIELQGEHSRETTEDVEVVPFDHGADGGGENHSPDAVFGGTAHRDCVCTAGHASSCTHWLL